MGTAFQGALIQRSLLLRPLTVEIVRRPFGTWEQGCNSTFVLTMSCTSLLLFPLSYYVFEVNNSCACDLKPFLGIP